MMNFKRTILATIVASTVAMSSYAESLTIKQSEMESDLESRLRQNINAFIPNSKYNLNVNIALGYSESEVKPKPDSLSVIESIQQAQKICDQLLSVGSNVDEQTTKPLAGMPALPGFVKQESIKPVAVPSASQELVKALVQMKVMDQCQAQFARLSNQEAEKPVEKQIEIKSIAVDLTVDDEVSESLMQLLKGNIVSKAGINLDRGDKIAVSKIDFDGQSLAASIGPTGEFISKHYPWLFGMGLIALIGMYLLMRNRQTPMLQAISTPANGSSLRPAQSFEDSANTAMNDLVKLNMSSPELLFELNADDSKVALIDAAKSATYLIRGKNGVRNIFGSVSDMQYDELIANSKEMQFQDAHAAIEQLTNELAAMPQRVRKKAAANPFDFLEKLSSGQIFEMIHEENSESVAIVLSQMNSANAAQVLRLFTKEQRADLMVKLSATQRMDSTNMIAVAQKLAEGARNLPKLKNVAAKGMDITSQIFDCFDQGEQLAHLAEIRSVSPSQYLEIREKIILWQDITRIAQSALGSVLLDIQPSTLAKALATSVDEERIYVVKSLPSGMQKRVLNAINMIDVDNENPEEIIKSRTDVVGKIRAAINTGAISASEISPLKFTELDGGEV